MARYLGPKCRLERRLGEKLGIRHRCTTAKCALTKRNYPPGQHGQQSRQRFSGFGLQLREKQKAKRIYGILERQFRKYFEHAIRHRGNTAESLMRILELRLDNVVYRLGFANSRNQARQLIKHRHISINGKFVTIPSYAVSAGDRIRLRDASPMRTMVETLRQESQERTLPSWLLYDASEREGTILAVPTGADLAQGIEMQLVVEYYSR